MDISKSVTANIFTFIQVSIFNTFCQMDFPSNWMAINNIILSLTSAEFHVTVIYYGSVLCVFSLRRITDNMTKQNRCRNANQDNISPFQHLVPFNFSYFYLHSIAMNDLYLNE